MIEGYFLYSDSYIKNGSLLIRDKYPTIRALIKRNRWVLDTRDGSFESLSDSDIELVISLGLGFINVTCDRDGIYRIRMLNEFSEPISFFGSRFLYCGTRFILDNIRRDITLFSNKSYLEIRLLYKCDVKNYYKLGFITFNSPTVADMCFNLIRRFDEYIVVFFTFISIFGTNNGVLVFDYLSMSPVHFDSSIPNFKSELIDDDFNKKLGSKLRLLYG